MNAFIYFWCVWTLPLTQWRTLGVQPSGCRRWRAASEVGRVWGHGPEVQGPHCGPFWSILPSLQPAHLSLVCVCNFPGLAVFSPRAAPLTETRFPSQSQNIEFWWMFLNHFCCFFFFLCLFDFLHLIYTVFKLKHKVFFSLPRLMAIKAQVSVSVGSFWVWGCGSSFRFRLQCLVGLSNQSAPPRPERDAVQWNKMDFWEPSPSFLLSSFLQAFDASLHPPSQCQALLDSRWLPTSTYERELNFIFWQLCPNMKSIVPAPGLYRTLNLILTI